MRPLLGCKEYHVAPWLSLVPAPLWGITPGLSPGVGDGRTSGLGTCNALTEDDDVMTTSGKGDSLNVVTFGGNLRLKLGPPSTSIANSQACWVHDLYKAASLTFLFADRKSFLGGSTLLWVIIQLWEL